MRATCAAAAIVIAIATPATAGVVVGAGVPFSADDLERALSVRRPQAASLVLDVAALGPGRVRVVAAEGRWVVDVGLARGSDAARLVALNVLGDAEAEGLVGPVPPRRPWVRLAAVAGASRGLQDGDLSSTIARLAVERGRRWWVGGGLDWRQDVRLEPAGMAPVDGWSWLARAVVGRTLGPIELCAGGLFGRVDVDSDGSAQAWVGGATGAVRASWSMGPRWALVGAFEGDVFQHRIEVRSDGVPVAATPRVALGATLGLRWELGR
ncbi:MAG TPA: hypothetical protein VHE35_27470 [Kofleriaceae bacterium]|nr:hypothetical protein [Kofleriaceae bacterium]